MREVTHLVTVHKLGGEVEHLLLTLSYDAPRWGQQMTSLNWFNERELGRAFGDQVCAAKTYDGKTQYTSTRVLTPVEQMMHERSYPEFPVDQMKSYSSVWDLYAAIGYDYKRQRYVRQD